MRKETLIPEHTVPEETKIENILAITIYPENKNVTIHTDDMTTNHVVNIQPVLDSMSDSQKNVVKVFLKK